MTHLVEFLKIIDGALSHDLKKVSSYAQLLADKLDTEGEHKAATRIRQAVRNPKNDLITASAVTNTGRVPVDNDSRISLADEQLFTTNQVAVFIESQIHNLLEQFISHIHSADQLIAHGVGISPSLLLYGPSGCGKTEIAHYISARLELPILTARTDALISSYLGNTAKNLRILFEHAMRRPCVLFLDELDALAKLRDDQHELGELKRVVVSLLQNIDALKNGTIIVGATNHEHLLDPAVWRRFAYKAHINLPSESIRELLFAHFLGEYCSHQPSKLAANISEGFTGADIRQVCEDSKREAIVTGKSAVDHDDLLAKILRLRWDREEANNGNFSEMIRKARMVNPRVFTYRRLAKLFDISVGKAHEIVKSEVTNNG